MWTSEADLLCCYKICWYTVVLWYFKEYVRKGGVHLVESTSNCNEVIFHLVLCFGQVTVWRDSGQQHQKGLSVFIGRPIQMTTNFPIELQLTQLQHRREPLPWYRPWSQRCIKVMASLLCELYCKYQIYISL